MSVFSKFMKVLAAGAASLLFVACGGNGSKVSQADENNMIPDNAVCAVKVDLMSLWEKTSGDPGSQVRQLTAMAKMFLPSVIEENIESEALADIANEFLSDPATLGIALDKPAVMSAAFDVVSYEDDEYTAQACLTVLLNDSEAFNKVADEVLVMAREEGLPGTSKTVVDDDYTHYIYVAEDGAALDLGVGAKSAVLRLVYDPELVDYQKTMVNLFAKGGPKKTDGLKAFNAADEDMALWLDLNTTLTEVMEIVKEEERSLYAQLQPMMNLYEGSSVTATLNFEDGKTVMHVNVYGNEAMDSYNDKYYAQASDKYFESVPESSVFVVNLALKDVAGMLEEMAKSNPDFEELLPMLEEVGIDEDILKGLPGQITLALDGKGIDTKEIPGFVAVMECEPEVYALVESYLEEYAELYDDVYVIDGLCAITYTDGALYAVESGLAASGYYHFNSEYADVIEKGGLVIDLEQLPKHLLDEFAQEIDDSMSGNDLLEYVNALTVAVDAPLSTTVTLYMADKDHNLLEKLGDLLAGEVMKEVRASF